MVRLSFTVCLLVLSTIRVDAKRSDPVRVDSLLAVAADTLLHKDRREALMKDALSHDRSGKAMHALARFLHSEGHAGIPSDSGQMAAARTDAGAGKTRTIWQLTLSCFGGLYSVRILTEKRSRLWRWIRIM